MRSPICGLNEGTIEDARAKVLEFRVKSDTAYLQRLLARRLHVPLLHWERPHTNPEQHCVPEQQR